MILPGSSFPSPTLFSLPLCLSKDKKTASEFRFEPVYSTLNLKNRKELECIKAEMRYSLDIFNVNMNYTMKRWECQAPLPLWHALYDEEHENLKFKRLTS